MGSHLLGLNTCHWARPILLNPTFFLSKIYVPHNDQCDMPTWRSFSGINCLTSFWVVGPLLLGSCVTD